MGLTTAESNHDRGALIGVITVSDRASRGDYEDRGGPAIHEYLDQVLTSPWTAEAVVIPDEQAGIESTIKDLARSGCCLILTTGGTGPAARDVTPEATEAACTKMLAGLVRPCGQPLYTRFLPLFFRDRQPGYAAVLW